MELPPPWELRESTRYPGRCYYYNPETQESSWLRPISYPGNKIKWPPIIFVLHILIKYSDIDSSIERTKTQAREEISEIAKELISGNMKFDVMAREKSEDMSTRDSGGIIGWIKFDAMPLEFSKMAWQLRPGEMSPPVETKDGWHLILRRG